MMALHQHVYPNTNSAPSATDLAYAEQMVKRFFPPYVRVIGKTVNAIGDYNMNTACKLTMDLLSVALRRKLKAPDYRFYLSGKLQKHSWSKHRFYTYRYGKGPSILLLHGWCSNGSYFAPYVSQLVEQGFEVIVMDAPGHGLAPGRFLSVPDYIKCVREVLWTRAKWHGIIAHSMGSLTGIIGASEAGNIDSNTRCALMSTFSDCDNLMSKFVRCMGISETVLSNTRNWITEYTGKPLTYFNLTDHLGQMGCPSLLIADKQISLLLFLN